MKSQDPKPSAILSVSFPLPKKTTGGILLAILGAVAAHFAPFKATQNQPGQQPPAEENGASKPESSFKFFLNIECQRR